MHDTTPQTAAGKVLWHFSMSLDGFVAGPGHNMDWMPDATNRPGLVEEYIETTGAVLGGRDGWDAFPDPNGVYGGDWQGPIFVLTHHPDDAAPPPGVTFLNCDVAEAVETLRQTPGPFDLIFNDIDKQGYPESLGVIGERLRPGGLLLVDNLLWSGRVLDQADASPATAGVRELTRMIFNDGRWTASIVPLRDGMLVAQLTRA